MRDGRRSSSDPAREASPQPPKSATDGFLETESGDLLSERGVTTVLVVGAATDLCVDATVGAAVSRSLNADLVSDRQAPAEKGDPDAHLMPENHRPSQPGPQPGHLSGRSSAPDEGCRHTHGFEGCRRTHGFGVVRARCSRSRLSLRHGIAEGDHLGDHALACEQSGALRSPAKPRVLLRQAFRQPGRRPTT
jgi:hypothetical protein